MKQMMMMSKNFDDICATLYEGGGRGLKQTKKMCELKLTKA